VYAHRTTHKLGDEMPIALTDKIVALLCSLTDDQIEALPPAERRRLEETCMKVMIRCQPTPKPRAGVLADLRRGRDS
jgi:hypothetical protein